MRLLLIVSLFLSASLVVTEEPNAYLAFKLNSKKVAKRIDSLHGTVTSLLSRREYRHNLDVSMDFIPSDKAEIRLISFYYDEAEHKPMISEILSKAAVALCDPFPGYLAFDNFFRDDKFVKGGVQDLDYTNFAALAKILNEKGIVYEEDTGIANEKAGFIAAFDVKISEKPAAASFLRELFAEPLHSSAYIDTIHFCLGNGPFCEDRHTIASLKIEDCSDEKDEDEEEKKGRLPTDRD